MEAVPPALAGGFFTSEPAGKPLPSYLKNQLGTSLVVQWPQKGSTSSITGRVVQSLVGEPRSHLPHSADKKIFLIKKTKKQSACLVALLLDSTRLSHTCKNLDTGLPP